MSGSKSVSVNLTRNQALVYNALVRADEPLSAYAILARLREQGLRAPLQVYRALDRLVSTGIVHRLESLNAFVACHQPDDDEHESIAFTICDICGKVTETNDARLARRLRDFAKGADFLPHRSVVELRGICRDCRRSRDRVWQNQCQSRRQCRREGP